MSNFSRLISSSSSSISLCCSLDRYSIAFFSHPNDDVDVTPLPSCTSADNPSRYPADAPVSAGAYLKMKLGASY
jgi:isopenicillin N synthase-like dioxygenase